MTAGTSALFFITIALVAVITYFTTKREWVVRVAYASLFATLGLLLYRLFAGLSSDATGTPTSSGDIAQSDAPAFYAQYFGATCKTHDLTIVDAGARWCGHCRHMEETTFANPSVKAAIANNGFVKVTEEESPELILALNVEGYPTTIFLDRECKEVHRARGFRAAEPFLDEVRTARGKLPH